MDSDTNWRHVDTQRALAADLLEGLSEQQWAQPSLCTEWSVRDVAAHLTFAQVRLREALIPALRADLRDDLVVRERTSPGHVSDEDIAAQARRRARSGPAEVGPCQRRQISTPVEAALTDQAGQAAYLRLVPGRQRRPQRTQVHGILRPLLVVA